MDANFMKRFLDFSFSLVVIILLTPLWFLVALLIKCEDGGPLFYRGVRVGLSGKNFRIFKFRTMVVDAEKTSISSTAEDDRRITRVGRLIRRFKIDELPQLLNVISGKMSLVGPRPQVEWAVKLYKGEEQDLLCVKPGITDYASLVFRNEGEILKGSDDPDRDYLIKIAPTKIKLGLEYIHNRSVWIDIKIISATAGALLGIDPLWCVPKREYMMDFQRSVMSQ